MNFPQIKKKELQFDICFMKLKNLYIACGSLLYSLFHVNFVMAGVPTDNADHLLFGGGLAVGTTLCELTISNDINITRAKNFRNQYMSEWNKSENLRDYQLVGTGFNLGITMLIKNSDSKFSICQELILK